MAACLPLTEQPGVEIASGVRGLGIIPSCLEAFISSSPTSCRHILITKTDHQASHINWKLPVRGEHRGKKKNKYAGGDRFP